MNYLRTAILLAGMTALFMAVGFMLGGETGMLLALVVAAGMNLFAYWSSDQMVLRMYGARQVDRRSAPQLYGIVEQLAHNADLPMPKVYVIDNPQPNAFATGRNPENAAVAATTGLLQNLTDEEVAGVMAHELAHVKNRDTLIMTITATIAGAISMLANFGAVLRCHGQRQPKQSARHRRRHSRGDPRAHGGNAGADGDQPGPRIRGRPDRGRDLRPPTVACLRAR